MLALRSVITVLNVVATSAATSAATSVATSAATAAPVDSLFESVGCGSDSEAHREQSCLLEMSCWLRQFLGDTCSLLLASKWHLSLSGWHGLNWISNCHCRGAGETSVGCRQS